MSTKTKTIKSSCSSSIDISKNVVSFSTYSLVTIYTYNHTYCQNDIDNDNTFNNADGRCCRSSQYHNKDSHNRKEKKKEKKDVTPKLMLRRSSMTIEEEERDLQRNNIFIYDSYNNNIKKCDHIRSMKHKDHKKNNFLKKFTNNNNNRKEYDRAPCKPIRRISS